MTGSLATGYIVPLVGFVVVALYGFLAPGVQQAEAVVSPHAV